MKKIIPLFLTTLAASGCELSDLPDEIPVCIEDQIRSELKNGNSDQDIEPHVDAYLYQGECVYIIDPGSGYADWLHTAYNEDCQVICEFGGFAGMNTCQDFDENTEDLGVIWEL